MGNRPRRLAKSALLATLGAAFLLALVASFAPRLTAPAAAAGQPNIVVLMVDDLGLMLKDDGNGHAVPDDRVLSILPNIKSTFLDHGLRFNDYTGNDPSCCPGRTNFLTGQYAHHTGVTVNDARLFDPQESLATELHGIGYQTFISGKYLNQTGQLDNKMPVGWSKAFITSGGYGGGTYYRNGKAVKYPASSYSTDLFSQFATAFVRGATAQQPIFLMVTPYAPHSVTSIE